MGQFGGSFSWAPEGCPGGPPPRPLRAVIATQTGQFWGQFWGSLGSSFGPCPAGQAQNHVLTVTAVLIGTRLAAQASTALTVSPSTGSEVSAVAEDMRQRHRPACGSASTATSPSAVLACGTISPAIRLGNKNYNLYLVFGRFPAELGPETRSNGSGSKVGAERTQN